LESILSSPLDQPSAASILLAPERLKSFCGALADAETRLD
jgi:hypothetical protein